MARLLLAYFNMLDDVGRSSLNFIVPCLLYLNIHVQCYNPRLIDQLFLFYFEVYEETAGLMVNDPVLRTHKVSIPFI